MGRAERRRAERQARKTQEPAFRVRSTTSSKLIIAVPMYGSPPAEAWIAFIELCKNLSMGHEDFDIVATNLAYVDFARNDIVRRASKRGAKEILFIDQDVIYPDDLYWKLARHDKPVVSALYFKRLPPYDPLVFDWVDRERIDVTSRKDYDEGLVECGAVGLGATLIQMEAIDKVLEWQLNNGEKHPNPFRVFPPVGEDIFFCAHCREAGIPVYCDTTVKCLHIGLNPVSETHFKLQNRYGSLDEAAARLHELEAKES
jgi:hypothetical protein